MTLGVKVMWEFLVEAVRQWQSITGAVVGGIFSLLVAIIVGHIVRHREDRAAGMLLVGSLVQLMGRKAVLETLMAKQAVPDADRHKWLAEKLVQSRPKLSSLFEASVVRLMPAHQHLAAHLELLKTFVADMDEALDRLDNDYKNLHEKGKPLRPIANVDADAKIATICFNAAVRHAECAERLIARFVLGRFPWFQRMRQCLFPTKEEAKCQKLLKTGDA